MSDLCKTRIPVTGKDVFRPMFPENGRLNSSLYMRTMSPEKRPFASPCPYCGGVHVTRESYFNCRDTSDRMR